MNYTKEQLEMMSAEDLDTIIGGGAVDMSKYEKKADDAWMPKPHVAAAGDFAGQGEMGIADTAANMVEQTGQDASDSTAANFLTNTANALSGNLIPNVRKKSLQTLARGFYEDADGKRRYLEWSPEEQDYLLDKAMSDGWTGLARAAGSATGGLFGGKAIGGNALMKEWEDGEGKKYERGSTEWSIARLKHAQKLASMMLGDTVATEQNAQTEAAERGSTAAANIVAKGAPNLAYTAAYLSPWGIALNTALGAAGKAEGLQTDAMAYDEDGNLVTTAKGDTAGTAWLKGSASSLAEMGSELVGGKIGGAIVGRALRPLKNAAGRAVGSTAAGRSVLRFGDRIGNLFERTSRRAHLENPFEENLEELETAWFDALLGTDKRDSELKGTNPLGRFADATKEFFTPKNILELNEAMLLTMGAGAFVAAATDRGEYRASRGTLATGRGEAEAQMYGKRVDDVIRAHGLLTEEQMKDATTEEKTAALNAWIQGLSEDEIRQKIDAATGLVDRLANRIEGRNKFADNVAAIAGEMENAQGKNRFSDLTLSSPEAGSFDFASVAGVPGKDDKGNAVTAYADPQSGVRVEESVDGDGDVRYRVRGANGAYVAGPGGKAYMTDAAEASAVADRAAREQNIRALERADKENFVRSEIGRIGIPGKYEVKATMDEVKNLVPGIENDENYDPNSPAVEIPAGSVLSDGTRTDAPFTVYVLDNIGTRDEATRKVIHEAGIHLMLDQAFENDDDRAKFLFGIDKRAIRYGVDYVARAYGKTADDVLDDAALREEALAHSAEAATSTPTMLGKFVHAFREMARGMGAEIPLNDEELGVALREMRGKMFGSPEIGEVQAGIDERKETMRKLYEQGEADKAIAEGWAENQDEGIAGETAEGGELARMEEEQRRQTLAQHQRDVREREEEVRDEKQRRREKRSAEAIDAQAKANPNVPNEDQSKFDYRAKITVSPAPKEETKKMPIYSDMEYNGHKVKVGPLLRGGKEWGRLIELPDGNVILAQGAKSNRAALNQMRKALDRLLPNKDKSKEGPKTARSVNWGPSDFVEWVRATKHRNPRYEDLDEYRAYVERKAEEAKAEKERAAKDKAHAERQKQIEDAFKWGEYGFVKWVRDTKGREPNEDNFYADLQEYEAYKEKSAMDAADEAAREAEHKRIKADIEHAFGERDKELRRERSHRAKRAAYKRSIRRFIEEHGNAYPALEYWLEHGRKMISGADSKAQEALARYSTAERMFLAGFGDGGTAYDLLVEDFVNQYRNQETTNERHYDGDMTVEDILDQAISERRKYQQWVKEGARSAAEEELEGLEAADHDARRKLAAEDAQIKEYALDEIAAKEEWEKEYADAVGFIENEWNAAEEAKLSPENLAKCEIGINAIRIDHHDKVFYFAGWDAEDGILTLVDPDAEDGNRVYYRVTADGIQEAKANGQRNETGTADNRAGAADAGGEEGGGKEEAGKGKGGGFKLKSATAGEIAAEEKRDSERKETERRKDAPLKAGKGETGQSLLDLGGAEGEDLFNHTERKGDAKDEFAKIKDGAKDAEALASAVEEKAKEYEREADDWEKREYKPTDRTVEVDGEERRVDELNEERRKKKVAELRGKADALRKALADDVKGAKEAAYRAWLKKYGLNDTEARRKEFERKQNGKDNAAGAAAAARRIPAGEGELTDAERAWLGKTEVGKAIVSNYDNNAGDDKDFAVRQLRRSIENNKDALGVQPAKAETKPAAAMDAKSANKVLGMDAALGDAELRRKMAAWEAHRDERPGFAQKADAAKAILAYRAAKGKADARSTEVAARPKPEAATAAKEEAENDGTPRSREGLADVLEASGEVGAEDVGRIVKGATDAEVSALFDAYDTDEVGAAAGEVLDAIAMREAKADADAEAANAGGKKDGGAPSVPTDEGFAAWATGRDGKPMSFASEEERANARATFDEQVRRGRVDGKTGRSNVRWNRSGIYTGSAADYEKPSLVKVGTGEGSQVYGWGLYGSTVRGVAEGYAAGGQGDHTVVMVDGKKWKPGKNASIGERTAYEQLDDLSNTPEDIASYCESMDGERYKEAAKFIRSHQIEIRDPHSYVYEQTFFTNRADGDESHLLKWYEPVSEANKKRIVDELNKEKVKGGNWHSREDGIVRYIDNGTVSVYQFKTNEDLYRSLKRQVFGSFHTEPEKAASEFLARADIDGIKYPVDSYGGKGVKDGDKVGWNYVSFRDDNIRVDHKWVDGKQRWSKAAPARDMSGWEYDGNLPPTDGTMALLREYNRNPDKNKGTLYENAVRWTDEDAERALERSRKEFLSKKNGVRWSKAVTAEDDAAYADAVARGDRATALRMIRDAADKAMPNTKVVDENGEPLVVYRGRDGRDTVLDTMEDGIHFTTSKSYADEYGDNSDYNRDGTADRNTITTFLNLRNPLDLRDVIDNATSVDDFKNRLRAKGVDLSAKYFSPFSKNETIESVIDSASLENLIEDPNPTLTDYLGRSIRKQGFDGIITYEYTDKENPDYIVFNPHAIKSADITYDDAGKLIPLSERFNPQKQDIRWSKAADGVPADVREELHGITQERINYYRAKVGLPPLESKRRTLEEMGREGQGLFANRDLVNTIVDAVSKKPRALSEEETVAIDLANAELEQQYDLKMAQVDEAMLRGNKADELRLRSEADALRDRIDKFGRALRDTGSVTGRALALRRLMVSRNLTLAGFTSECEALKGKALTDEEKKDVAAAYRAVRDAIAGKDGAVLRELTKRIRDAAASDVNAIVAELKRRGAKSVPADVDGKFKDAVKQLVAWNDVSGGILTGLQGAKDTVNGIIRYHVANGVGENLTGKAKYDAVMGATLGTVKQYLGGATMEELEQAVSGYGISRPLSLDETELAVRDMDLQAKRYRALADLLNRKFPKATGDRRAPTSDEVKRLDAEIREKANELKMQAGLSPEEMQKLVDKRLATLESRLQNYRVMLMTENFKPKDRRSPRIMTPEIMAKEKEVAAAMKKVEERKKHYRAINHPLNFRVGQNYASDWLNMLLAAPRVFRTMLDLSATGAQGAALFVSHPVEGMKALGKSVAAFYSSKKADELQLAMDADPDWQEFQKFGGHAYSISDVALDAVPEEFRAADTSVKIGGKTYSLDTLPFGIGKAVRSSERSFGAFLNAMNLAMYKAMKNGGGWSDPAGPTDTQKRDLAEALNVASGYGYGREGKGWWDKVMSATFWAPRYTVAGVKQAVGYEVWSPFLRGGKDERSFKDRAVASKQLAKEEARRLASMAAWTLLATLLFGKKDPEWIEEILDPRSGHFGNVRIGNREVSFLGPMKQWLTFMSRMINGNTVKNGVKKDAGRFESIGRLIRGKMSPLFGLGWDLASGEDYIGDKVEWGRLTSGKNAEGKNAVGAVPHILESVGYPLSLNDVHEAIKEDGIANALLMAPFAITGFAKNSAPVNDYNLVTDTYEKLSGEYGTALRNDPKKARQMLKDNPELRDRSRINDLMKYVRSFERQAKKYEDAGKEVPEGLSRRIEDYKRRAIAAVRKARGAK